nr:pyridoxal-dependent decarboxylase [uncultured Jannaschia sp.]
MPPDIRAGLATPLPEGPTALENVVREVFDTAMAYPMGNTHPRFWSWYMGAGNLTGVLAEFLAAVQGSNLGGGNHAAACMDDQVAGWLKEMVGFPAEASGTLTSGGSEANLVGLTVARNVMAGVDVRAEGIAAAPRPLRFYAFDQVHGCHLKAVEGLGLGRKALRLIPTGGDFRIDLAALRVAIAEDRAAGLKPACIIGTAGTVNAGQRSRLIAARRVPPHPLEHRADDPPMRETDRDHVGAAECVVHAD